jgi:hypothetical protein
VLLTRGGLAADVGHVMSDGAEDPQWGIHSLERRIEVRNGARLSFGGSEPRYGKAGRLGRTLAAGAGEKGFAGGGDTWTKWFDPIRDTPRFREIERKMNLPP